MSVETQGTLLYMSSSTGVSTSASALIGSVKGISGIGGGEAADIDTTVFASTAKTFIVGLRDEGSISVSVVYDPTNVGQIALDTVRASRAKRTFAVDLSTVSVTASSTRSRFFFDGYIKSFSKDAEIDGIWEGSVGIRITGAVGTTQQTT